MKMPSGFDIKGIYMGGGEWCGFLLHEG